MFCMDDLVTKDHFLRVIDNAIDWNFIYVQNQDKYSPDSGRPSKDSIMPIKIHFIWYLYKIKRMWQIVKEISTFSKNFTRRFKDMDLFERIFSHMLIKTS